MARSVRNAKIDTRSARAKLAQRREPYWTVISAGRAIGYRRGTKGGTWIARLRDEQGKQHYEAIGAADDAMDADGDAILSFAQAQEAARSYFTKRHRELAGHAEPMAGPYTVALAMADYFAAREHRGSKGVKADRYAAEARILPDLGGIEIDRLTARRLRDWQAGLVKAPRLLRTAKGSAERATRAIDEADPDALRARRATANRVLTVLKAALNFAFHEGRAASDEAWRKVKAFREADAPVIRYLTAPECVRLVNACDAPFRDLVRGALLTGCRYGELVRLRTADFDAQAGTIAVRLSKAGKPRHVVLTDEGRALFVALTAGAPGDRLVFRREDGKAWGPSHQQRPLEAASRQAAIAPPVTFHCLRHTYASTLAMKGAPMGVIAAQLGHADTRMTERHYAHLAPSYVADTVRAALPSLGIVPPAKVVALVS